MTAVFSTIVDMSVKGGVVILAILLMRFLLLKAPKKFSYLLWSVAAFRLCVPVSFQAVFSIFSLRKSEAVAPVTPPVVTPSTPVVNTPPLTVPSTPVVTTPVVTAPPATVPTTPVTPPVVEAVPTPTLPVDVTQAQAINWESLLSTAFAVLWLVGLAAMVIWGIVSYAKLYRRMQNAVRLEGNVYASDRISSPFTLGFIKPRIYLPFGLDEREQAHIIAHERYHIKRLDHVVKPFAYLLLAVHWFNPLCWLAFNRMSMDMEMSCDEAILRRMSEPGSKAQYTETLLSVASANRFPAPSPLAFNDGGGAKQRIKHALNWKKPKVWVTVLACVLCIATLVACAADKVVPKVGDREQEAIAARSLTEQELTAIETFLNDKANNGLIGSLNLYTGPKDIDLYFALSEGAGIGRFHTELEEAQRQAVVNAPGYTEFAPCLVFKGADIKAYLQTKLGVSLADLSGGTADLDYVEEYDLYFLQHNDYNRSTVDVTKGRINRDGHYVATYYVHEADDLFTVTLRKTAEGYQFFSNVEGDQQTEGTVTPRGLTVQELTEVQTFLQDVSNYGFVGPHTYAAPQGIDPLYVFYDGAGLSRTFYDSWSGAEQQAVLGTTQWNERFVHPFKFAKADLEAFFTAKTGLSLNDCAVKPQTTFPYTPGNEAFMYSAEYEAYYVMHGDGAYLYKAQVHGGLIGADGLYTVYYSDGSAYGVRYAVTLRKTTNGYHFVSNVEAREIAELIAQAEEAAEDYTSQSLPAGLTAEAIRADLEKRTDLIPFDAVLGGTNYFSGIHILSDRYVYVTAGDDHIYEDLLFQYAKTPEGGIQWMLLGRYEWNGKPIPVGTLYTMYD
ncbi:MAG: M56 family metallopeptidase [Clostridia bacterium]|nr:M56 family metallopeptidase [Clostridia bacterium]